MLRSHRTLTLTVLAIAFLTGCDRAPTAESLMEDQISAVEEATKVMATIKDEASANAAKAKLQEIAEKFKKLGKQGKDLGEPTKEKREELEKKYQEKLFKALTAMQVEGSRINSDPKLAAIMKDISFDAK